MCLEPQMRDALSRIAWTEGVTINNLCTQIDVRRGAIGLTSATRVFIISYFRFLAQQYELRDGAAGPGLSPVGNGLKGASRAKWVLDTVAIPQEPEGPGLG